METKTYVREVSVNKETGHIRVRLQAETVNGNVKWLGPLKDYGVDAETFHGRFNGDVAQLKTWLVSEHKAMIGVHEELVEHIAKLHGEAIG